jgi:hypothetical protein
MLRPLLLHHPSPAAPYLPASSPHRPPPGRPVRRSRSGYSSLFSPSSLEGYSPSLGHLSGASSSFADVVKGKGKVSAKGSAPDPGCSDGKGKEPVDRGMVEGSHGGRLPIWSSLQGVISRTSAYHGGGLAARVSA